jgi:sphinganine C4-monooxygenase
MKLKIPFFEQYRIHTPDDRDKRNKVTFGKVLLMVALQHVVQIVLGVALLKSLDPEADQQRYQQSIARYTSVLFSVLINVGQPKEKATLLANQLAVFIQDYVVSAVKFFIAM